jgi:cobalamin-dependent methionine synthase I
VSRHILDSVPFQIGLHVLTEKLHLKEGSNAIREVKRRVDEAQIVGKPKALYKASCIESKEDHGVLIDGVRLRSRVLRVNLEPVHRVFPFVATCGMELERWANRIEDLFERYCAETIKEMALRMAVKALEEHLARNYCEGSISRMCPGSLTDWPLQEQAPLFQILGDTEEAVGVRLTESLLMIPTKSLSGIFFFSELAFESCQLCAKERCPGRKAAYDKDLYEKRYRLR